MSRNSRAHNAARKRKKKRQQARQVLIKLTPGESTAISLIVGMWELQAARHTGSEPVCAGQIVSHDNGAFECVGGTCTPATIFQHEHIITTVAQCHDKGITHTYTGCSRCWSCHPRQEQIACGGMVVVHCDGSLECTVNRLTQEGACPGVSQVHALTIPCEAQKQCELCGTDNEAIREKALRDAGMLDPQGRLLSIR